jgi:hypothetical protein
MSAVDDDTARGVDTDLPGPIAGRTSPHGSGCTRMGRVRRR